VRWPPSGGHRFVSPRYRVVMIIAVTRRLPAIATELLEGAGFTVRMHDADDPPSRGALLSLVDGADGIICLLSDRVDEALLDAAGPGLRVVANYAVGLDNVDLEACRAQGIAVAHTPGVLTDATADLAWALLLAVARRVREGDALVRSGGWSGWSPLQLLGTSLAGRTFGVVGLCPDWCGSCATCTRVRHGRGVHRSFAP